ncbi:hypothetical protein FACS1894151_11160 [Spirochaetia bacterium]|nr:hypothetical protein FACS1894151_11160 [Spirochaetia bacterium]
MKDLTDEEAAALDEYYTTHIPKVGPNEGGFFANRTRRDTCSASVMMPVDDLSAAYIRSACEAERKTPVEIIGELVREKNHCCRIIRRERFLFAGGFNTPPFTMPRKLLQLAEQAANLSRAGAHC